MTEEQVWSLDQQYKPTDVIEMEFDDVIFPVQVRPLIVSWYLWYLHRQYPECALLAEHYLGSMEFSGSAITKLQTRIVKSLNDSYWGRLNYDTLAKQIYHVSNMVHNMVASRLGAYVETMDARDYVNILYNPEIRDIRQRVIDNPTPKSIRTLYSEIEEVMARPDFLQGNAIVEAMRMKNASPKQVLQCIGVRGYTTDINSVMFKDPIVDCFGTGIKRFVDFLKESRSGAKALIFQKDPIRDTEYFNRCTQLLSQSVMHLIPGDCGSTGTFDWEVHPDDLPSLYGKYYIDDNGALRYVDKNDLHLNCLVGKRIRLRTPHKCNHIHRQGICQTCLGVIGLTVPAGSNIGHVVAYLVGNSITQAVLSVKHLDGSTEVKAIELDKNDLRYIKLDDKRNELIYLLDKYKGKKATLLLKMNEIVNLAQALNAETLNNISVYKVSALSEIGIKVETDDETTIDWVTVSAPSRPSSLTLSFLEHVRQNRPRQETSKYAEISLEGWDYDRPFAKLQQKQVNMLDFMKQFRTMIECSATTGVKKLLDPNKDEDMVKYLRHLYDYASQHIYVHLSYLEIISLASLVVSEDESDYNIPLAGQSRQFASASDIMKSRSVGGALAYEEHLNVIMHSKTYNRDNRLGAPMDAMFVLDPQSPVYDGYVYQPTQPE